MQIEQLALPKQKAQREWETYKQEIRESKTQFNKDMLALYAHMKHGGKVLDLWESVKLAGLNVDGDPKLAITNADSPKVRFVKNYTWTTPSTTVSDGGAFYPVDYSWRKRENQKIRISQQFFPSEWPKDQNGNIVRKEIETVTPIIPARIMNVLRSHNLANYHILWEVEKWQPIPPKDPILLKRISPNMFLILATWDLTPLERAVIRGRL